MADLPAVALKGIDERTTLEIFRKGFDALPAKRGWTGEDTRSRLARRTNLTNQTNLRSPTPPAADPAGGRNARGRCHVKKGSDPFFHLIHARPLAGRCSRIAVSVSSVTEFQSTPGQLAGRCASSAGTSHRGRLFQSTPGQLAGRCHPGRNRRSDRPPGFNPRPANWPGDARRLEVEVKRRDGFNPRPANWPGDARGRTAK
jgi:hypothetical protein